MGSEKDTREKALELTGCITLRLLSRQSGASEEDIIRALCRIGKTTGDWRVRAGCKKAIQLLRHRMH